MSNVTNDLDYPSRPSARIRSLTEAEYATEDPQGLEDIVWVYDAATPFFAMTSDGLTFDSEFTPSSGSETRRVRLQDDGTQTIANGGSAALTFADADVYDAQGWHDPASNNERITPVAGAFKLSASIQLSAGGASGRVSIFIQKFDASGPTTLDIGYNQVHVTASVNNFLGVYAEDEADTGDYFTVTVINDSGASIDVDVKIFTLSDM